MVINSRNIHLLFAVCLLAFQISISSCQKELNFDQPARTDTLPNDIPSIVFPVCPFCNPAAPLSDSSWSFKTKNSFLCGKITDGIITGDKNAFTFFGPSQCSTDTGLVITAYLEPAHLTSDTTNLQATGAVFYYYDHNSTDYILVSKSNVGFSLKIDRYTQSTGIATGSFSGGSFRVNNEFVYIDGGRFKVKLRK